MSDLNVLVMLEKEDANFGKLLLPFLKGVPHGAVTIVPDSGPELIQYCKAKKFTKIICANQRTLNKLIEFPIPQSINDWHGSLFERDGIEILGLNSPKQIFSTNEGSFIFERFISKITKPWKWYENTPFTHEVLTPDTVAQWYEMFASSLLTAIDIETFSWESRNQDGTYKNKHTIIECIGYCGSWIIDGQLVVHTVVMPIHLSEAPLFWVNWMRRFNALSTKKVMQNGLYDSFHCVRYSAPIAGYFFDTQSLFHSWYSELPKRLDFITAFTVRNSYYWKDLSSLGGLANRFEYNARDCWATLLSCFELLLEMPDWALANYIEKFDIWPADLACNLEGMLVDQEERARLVAKNRNDYQQRLAKMKIWFGPEFNPRSPPQVMRLMSIFGGQNVESSDSKALDKWAQLHPLNARFKTEIEESREELKLESTYLKPEDTRKGKSVPLTVDNDRIFYGLNPDGTDTARHACREGASWSGCQIQNIPQARGYIKTMYIPDRDIDPVYGRWVFVEVDGKQAEARCVAYLSGDANLIAAVESPLDFHKVNASRFFGVPYDEIDKTLRDLSKRTNHGANYNMGAWMLINTMGEKNVWRAKEILKLPSHYTLMLTAEHLLASYNKAYPTVKGPFYDYLIRCVRMTNTLVSAIGWTRYCFGTPSRERKDKLDLNAIVAHPSQNLSAGLLNRAFKRAYWEIQVPNFRHFRLKAQIHDSIFAMLREGRLDLARQLKRIATTITQIRDFRGVERTMVIPADIKLSYKSWGDMKEPQPGTIEYEQIIRMEKVSYV